MKVTYHTIAKDEYQAGDFVICERCGATLKNYAKINGQVYGLDCTAVILGKKESQVKKSWEHTIRTNRPRLTIAQYQAKHGTPKNFWEK